METDVWTAVDAYFAGELFPADPILEAALEASDQAGLPQIAVAPNHGAFLNLIARAIGARRILEIGTLGGYSTIWLARALPAGGKLITIELNPQHVEVARRNLAAAGLAEVAEVREGRAMEWLPRIAEAGEGPFDLTFVDADKLASAGYFDWAVRLSRSGSVIIVDNVVRDGAVADASSNDPSVKGSRILAEKIGRDARVDATAIQMVGVKGYDGMAIALVK